MPPKRQSLLSNISWLGLGNLLVKPVWFVFITALCMRYLRVEEYGLMMASLALATIVSALGDLGIPQYTVREVARTPEQTSTFASRLIPYYFLISLLTWILLFVIGPAVGYRDHLEVLLLAGAYAAGLRNLEYLRTYYRALEIMKFEAISIWVEKLFVVGLGTFFLLTTRTPAGTLLGMAGGLWITVLINILFIRFSLVPECSFTLDLSFGRQILYAAIPIGLYSLVNIIYMRSGTVLLEHFEGAFLTGQFSVAYRIVEALSVYPTIVIPPVFARLSALSKKENVKSFFALAQKSFLQITGGAALIGLLIFIVASPLIHLLNPDPVYTPSARYLQALMIYFPLSVLKYLLAMSLIALNRQRFLSGAITASTLLFLILCVLFIPLWKAIGLIAALTLSECTMVLLSLSYFLSMKHRIQV